MNSDKTPGNDTTGVRALDSDAAGCWTLERDADGIAWLTLDKPATSANVLSSSVLIELDGVLAGLERQLPRALVVLSAKKSGFVAGADIREFTALTDEAGGYALIRRGQQVLDRLAALPCPSVAAIHGFALGGGLELALACDLVVASDKARFGQPEINLGLIPGFGGTQRLPHRIGHNKARELIMTGDMFDAKTALELGLANQVVAPYALLETTRKLAEKIASKSAVALRQAKAALRAAFTMEEDSGLRFEQEAFGVTFASADRVEGTTAFVEKRPPKWQHK